MLIFEHHRDPPDATVLEKLADLQARAYRPVALRGWAASEIAAILNVLAGQLIIACSAESDPLGFLLASVCENEGEILVLAVDPAFQRQKIASRLIAEMGIDERSVKLDRLVLEVASTNYSAIHLYETLKFHQIGVRRNYYRIAGGRADAKLMEKRYNQA